MTTPALLNVATSVRVVALGIPPFMVSAADGSSGQRSSSAKPAGDTARAPQRQRVLVVDDETLIADSLALILRRNGYDATAAYSGKAALQHIERHCPDVIIADVVMPDLNGVQLAKSVRRHCPDARILLISGNASTMHLLQIEAADGHFFEMLAKPVHPLEVLRSLKS